MRLGLHVHSLRYPQRTLAYHEAVRPPVSKLLADAWSPGLVDDLHRLGTKVVGRRVEDASHDMQGNVDRTLRWGAERGWKMDWLEWLNEEEQGKDRPEDWARACRYALKFLQGLDAARVGTRGLVMNTSTGQPEPERWSMPDCLNLARYMDAREHAWGVHTYYRPNAANGMPWKTGGNPYRDWGKVDGAWVGREWHLIDTMKRHGIRCRVIVTESGRDAVTGTAGEGAGYRDDPTLNYAHELAFMARHYTAMPEVIGWVDFGWAGSPKWESFDMAEDPVTTAKVAAVMQGFPIGGNMPTPDPQPQPGTRKFYEKVAWATEEAARILQREGYTQAHDYVVAEYAKDAIRKRDALPR